jgi:RNA polymerase sigma-70 factor (ECF subfamily)
MQRTIAARLWTAPSRSGPSGVHSSADASASNGDLQDASDRALVDACLAGRREAFDVIVQRHQRPVYQLCYRFAPRHEDASDLAQDVFVRAYRALGGFKGDAALATWLYRIAVNVCLSRAALKTPKHESLDRTAPAREPADDGIEPADVGLLRRERASEIRAAIARLPDKQRATLILRVYHELPHAAIAGILGSSVGATKANFFHALANLKKLLQAGR